MGECIQRDVQPMRYEQADGSPVPGYSPIDKVVDTAIVSGDVCCEKGCEGLEFAGLLGACASSTETPGAPTFSIMPGIDILGLLQLAPDQCVAEYPINVEYFLTDGSVACLIPETITYSTEFGDDDFVVFENCCANAVTALEAGNEVVDYLDNFCHVEEELADAPDVPEPGSEVDFNDSLPGEDGEGVCTLLSGGTLTNYKDADFVTQYSSAVTTPDSYPQTIENRFCCIAYDPEGEINNSFELTFACEEIEVMEVTPVFNPDDMTCNVETETYFYVDLDANQMYDMEVDGAQFAYDKTSVVDLTGDACCQKAADDGDLATAEAACDECVVTEDDEFFTYDAPVCTRRFDRITNCYLSDAVDENDTVYTDETQCIDEILDASACCEAKQAGKAGVGLEEACAAFTFPDLIPDVGGLIPDVGGIIPDGLPSVDDIIPDDIIPDFLDPFSVLP